MSHNGSRHLSMRHRSFSHPQKTPSLHQGTSGASSVSCRSLKTESLLVRSITLPVSVKVYLILRNVKPCDNFTICVFFGLIKSPSSSHIPVNVIQESFQVLLVFMNDINIIHIPSIVFHAPHNLTVVVYPCRIVYSGYL